MIYKHDLWQHIDGFFDFDDVYQAIVKECANGDWIVEIGGFLGKSTCYLGKIIHDSGKQIRVLCVDSWPASYVVDKQLLATDPFEIWCANVKQSGWEDFILPLRTTSQIASTIIRNGLAAVYIDGDHTFGPLKQDIEAWRPKVRPGGILAGHDYGGGWADVPKAVHAVLGNKITIHRQTWVHRP